jgi:hypothetical protein
MLFEPKVLTIREFLPKGNDRRRITKPKMQRKVQWSLHPSKGLAVSNPPPSMVEFIDYIIEVKATGTALSINETIGEAGWRYWQCLDGNNRLCSILKFSNSPLKIKKDLIPMDWSENFRNELQKVSYDDFTRGESYENFEAFSEASGNAAAWKALPDERRKEMNLVYKGIRTTLHNWHFNDIRVQFNLHTNLSYEEMCYHYENINRRGIPLSRQDHLAATFEKHRLETSELKYSAEIQLHVENYYNNENEELELQENDTRGTLNLFEVLKGVDAMIKADFPKFTNFEKETSKLSNTFYMFNVRHGFNEEGYAVSDVNNFIDSYYHACKILNALYEATFPPSVKSAPLFYHSASAAIFASLMRYDPKEINTAIQKQFICNTNQDRTSKYVSLLKTINKVKEIWVGKWLQKYHKKQNTVEKYEGVLTPAKMKDLKYWVETCNVGHIDDYEKFEQTHKLYEDGTVNVFSKCQLKTLLKYGLTRDEKEPGKKMGRRALNRVECFIQHTIRHQDIPLCVIQNEVLEDDHIWPISISKWEGTKSIKIDLNRLGNRMDIPKSTNRKKGCRRLTIDFIRKYKLDLLGYPSIDMLQDANDSDHKPSLDSDGFNAYCAEREQGMIQKVCDNIRDFKAEEITR